MSDLSSDTPTAPAVNGNTATMRDQIVDNAAAAVNAVQNHPVTQQVTNGPVATSVKNQASATSNEFSGLADSRSQPSYTAANDTTLTHYHSFFYTLLSWKHPRASAISFGGSVLFIFALRYLPILRWFFKMSYLTLGVVALAEGASKYVMGSGVATSVRPRKYYRVPKESLEASLEDLEQLINFFVIEFQRILFAENIPVTVAAFLSAFLSYYLIKLLPVWGMALLGTCVIYLAPLIYISNQEFIDEHITHAQNVIGEQATQVKDLTAHHTSKGFESVKAYSGDYAAKASELVGSARQKIPLPASAQSTSATTKKEPYSETDFPTAPKSDLPSASSAETRNPAVYAPGEEGLVAASSA